MQRDGQELRCGLTVEALLQALHCSLGHCKGRATPRCLLAPIPKQDATASAALHTGSWSHMQVHGDIQSLRGAHLPLCESRRHDEHEIRLQFITSAREFRLGTYALRNILLVAVTAMGYVLAAVRPLPNPPPLRKGGSRKWYGLRYE